MEAAAGQIDTSNPAVSFKKVNGGEVAVITIHSPPANTLSETVRLGLRDHIRRVQDDFTVKFVVITSTGSSFSCGADIKEFRDYVPPYLGDVLNEIEFSRKVVIAAINGAALGGGAELALACHHRFASVDATFAFPEVKLGIIPGAGGTQRLPRLVGVVQAISLICTGRTINATTAKSIGLVDQLSSAKERFLNDAIDYGYELFRRDRLRVYTRQEKAQRPLLRRLSNERDRLGRWWLNPLVFFFARRLVARRTPPGMVSPLYALDAIRAATSASSMKEGLRVEKQIVSVALNTPQATALQYVFVSSREVFQVPPMLKNEARRKKRANGTSPMAAPLTTATTAAAAAVAFGGEATQPAAGSVGSFSPSTSPALSPASQPSCAPPAGTMSIRRVAFLGGWTRNLQREVCDYLLHEVPVFVVPSFPAPVSLQRRRIQTQQADGGSEEIGDSCVPPPEKRDATCPHGVERASPSELSIDLDRSTALAATQVPVAEVDHSEMAASLRALVEEHLTERVRRSSPASQTKSAPPKGKRKGKEREEDVAAEEAEREQAEQALQVTVVELMSRFHVIDPTGSLADLQGVDLVLHFRSVTDTTNTAYTAAMSAAAAAAAAMGDTSSAAHSATSSTASTAWRQAVAERADSVYQQITSQLYSRLSAVTSNSCIFLFDHYPTLYLARQQLPPYRHDRIFMFFPYRAALPEQRFSAAAAAATTTVQKGEEVPPAMVEVCATVPTPSATAVEALLQNAKQLKRSVFLTRHATDVAVIPANMPIPPTLVAGVPAELRSAALSAGAPPEGGVPVAISPTAQLPESVAQSGDKLRSVSSEAITPTSQQSQQQIAPLPSPPTSTTTFFAFIGLRLFARGFFQMLALLEEGSASVQDVELALKSFGFTSGPFWLHQAIGMDAVWSMVCHQQLPQLYGHHQQQQQQQHRSLATVSVGEPHSDSVPTPQDPPASSINTTEAAEQKSHTPHTSAGAAEPTSGGAEGDSVTSHPRAAVAMSVVNAVTAKGTLRVPGLPVVSDLMSWMLQEEEGWYVVETAAASASTSGKVPKTKTRPNAKVAAKLKELRVAYAAEMGMAAAAASRASTRGHRAVSAADIHRRFLDPMIDEMVVCLKGSGGCCVPRLSDLDVFTVNALGFPAWKGGLAHYSTHLTSLFIVLRFLETMHGGTPLRTLVTASNTAETSVSSERRPSDAASPPTLEALRKEQAAQMGSGATVPASSRSWAAHPSPELVRCALLKTDPLGYHEETPQANRRPTVSFNTTKLDVWQ